MISTYPSTGVHKVIFRIRDGSNDSQDDNENPDPNKGIAKADIFYLVSSNDRIPRVNSNR